MVELLLKHEKIDVNQAVDTGWTLLHIASQEGQSAVVKFLLKHDNINVNQATNEGMAPLQIAVNHPEVVELLRAHEVRISP